MIASGNLVIVCQQAVRTSSGGSVPGRRLHRWSTFAAQAPHRACSCSNSHAAHGDSHPHRNTDADEYANADDYTNADDYAHTDCFRHAHAKQ